MLVRLAPKRCRSCGEPNASTIHAHMLRPRTQAHDDARGPGERGEAAWSGQGPPSHSSALVNAEKGRRADAAGAEGLKDDGGVDALELRAANVFADVDACYAKRGPRGALKPGQGAAAGRFLAGPGRRTAKAEIGELSKDVDGHGLVLVPLRHARRHLLGGPIQISTMQSDRPGIKHCFRVRMADVVEQFAKRHDIDADIMMILNTQD